MPERNNQRPLANTFLRALFSRNAYTQSRPDQPYEPIPNKNNDPQQNSLPQRKAPGTRRSFYRRSRFASANFSHEDIVTVGRAALAMHVVKNAEEVAKKLRKSTRRRLGKTNEETSGNRTNACAAVEERRFSAAKASEIKSGFSPGVPHRQRVLRNLYIQTKKPDEPSVRSA
jgi:hypothetical protein